MKHLLKLMLLCSAVIFTTSCTTGYWADRGRDLADIGTLGAGYGFGVRAQVGPICPGWLDYGDKVGLRSGALFYSRNAGDDSFDIQRMSQLFEGRVSGVTGQGRFSSGNIHRGKKYDSVIMHRLWMRSTDEGYTQLELILGLGPGIRLGFNPGELLDFLLGFVYIDIYGDDLDRQ